MKNKLYLVHLLVLCFLGIVHEIKCQRMSDEEMRRILSSDMSILSRDSSAEDFFLYKIDNIVVRISSVKKKHIRTSGGSNILTFYQGDLLGGIVHVMNTNMLSVRTKGKIPSECIYYYGSKGFADRDNIWQTIVTTLEKKYKFKVLDTEDSCEVWKLQKTNPAKLVKYDPSKFDNLIWAGAMEHDTAMHQIVGFPLSFLCQGIEERIKTIVECDSTDYNRDNIYHFDNIPYALMSDLDGLNKLLEERYGIKFIKTKMLQKLKLIEFEE
jgi:hypothetical protein